jgi:hypothetical protein
MSVGKIFTEELLRLAKEGGKVTQLAGRPMTDPVQLAEADYYFRHDETRQQAAQRNKILSRERFINDATRDLVGDPPDNCNARGLNVRCLPGILRGGLGPPAICQSSQLKGPSLRL